MALTYHALRRAKERGISLDRVESAYILGKECGYARQGTYRLVHRDVVLIVSRNNESIIIVYRTH